MGGNPSDRVYKGENQSECIQGGTETKSIADPSQILIVQTPA